MDGQALANKKCHNCRRQRLRCDRSYPHCNKCLLTGKECLGYGQLFRWTGAVASRGKLAGKTSSAPLSPADTADEADANSSRASSAEIAGGTLLRPKDKSMCMQLTGLKRYSNTDLGAKPWVLADPLFQDLSHPHRYYISYFTTRLCRDLVSQDLPDSANPFHRLVPFTRSNPLLQNIMVATAAAHMSNLVRSAEPPSLQCNGQLVYKRGEASQRALTDALVAKQKALRLMNSAITDIGSVPVDIILASSFFFINVELLDSGRHGWRAHMEGAGRLMSMMQTIEAPIRELRDYLLSDCFCYFVLASAFTPSTSSLQTYFESTSIPSILEKTTATSYLCCPPEILEIFYAATQLSNVSIEDAATAERIKAEGFELLRRVQQFDVRGWVLEALKFNFEEKTVESRVNVGLTHRLAACIYIMQAIQPVAEEIDEETLDLMYDGMVDQLEKVPFEDRNFKGTSWPTFVAGAGAKDPEKRDWVLERFRKLLVACPWGFMNTAVDTLPIIWKNADNGIRNWVLLVKDPAMNFLIV